MEIEHRFGDYSACFGDPVGDRYWILGFGKERRI
jgi:hypothetical protein